MESLFSLKGDFWTSVALLDIHHLLCLAHSPTKLLPKLISGRTKTLTNMKREKFTNYQRNSTRKLLNSIWEPLMPSLPNYHKNKQTILMLRLKVHSSMNSTDTE